MTTELTTTDFKPSELALITNTVAKDATPDELKLFLYVAGKRGLNPLTRQIHFVKRGAQGTIQTGIDGFRLIAQRTGQYAPSGKATQFEVDKAGKLISATVFGNKIVNGTAFEFSATAYFSEYAPMLPNGQLFPMWQKMPRTMLEKCAEAKLLRKGFPEELSGLYADEEMHQADAQPISVVAAGDGATTTVTDTPEGEKTTTIICPKHGTEMRKNKWGGYSHIVDGEKTPEGKAVWCNIKAQDLIDIPAPMPKSPTKEPDALSESLQGEAEGLPMSVEQYQQQIVGFCKQLGWTKEGGEITKLVIDNFKGCKSPLALSPDQRKVFLNTLADLVSQKGEQAKLIQHFYN